MVTSALRFVAPDSAIGRISGELAATTESTVGRVVHIGITVGDGERVRVGARARAAKDSANVSLHVVRTESVGPARRRPAGRR